MKLSVNGNEIEYTGKALLVALIEQMQLNSGRIAVELNLNIMPRSEWGSTKLKDGDKLEIVHFVGGGSF